MMQLKFGETQFEVANPMANHPLDGSEDSTFSATLAAPVQSPSFYEDAISKVDAFSLERDEGEPVEFSIDKDDSRPVQISVIYGPSSTTTNISIPIRDEA